MSQTFVKFLQDLNKPKSLREIREVEEKKQEIQETKERKRIILERIHEFDIEHKHDLNCKRSIRGCFIALLVAYTTKTNYKKVLLLAEPILRALTEPNLDMVDQHFTLVNNAFKHKFGKDSDQHVWSKKTLHLTIEEKRMRNEMANRRRLESNTNPHDIMDTQVYKLILKGQEIVADWKDKFIAIALSCGARLIEIASDGVSRFSESKEAPGQLHQEGVAKDEHGSSVRGDERHVTKPVIQLTVQELLTMIKEARQLLAEEKKNIPQLYALLSSGALQQNGKLNSDQKKFITNRIDSTLNERVKQVLGEEYHFHTLRAIYGNMSHQLYGNAISLNAWLARVLGHKPGSISTAVSYTTVIISKQLATGAHRHQGPCHRANGRSQCTQGRAGQEPSTSDG